MTYIFQLMSAIGVAAIIGVIKVGIDNAVLKSKVKSLEARMHKLDEMGIEGKFAEIQTDLKYIRKKLDNHRPCRGHMPPPKHSRLKRGTA